MKLFDTSPPWQARRVRRKFLWSTKWIGREGRRREWACWREIYDWDYQSWLRWKAVKWITEEEYAVKAQYGAWYVEEYDYRTTSRVIVGAEEYLDRYRTSEAAEKRTQTTDAPDAAAGGSG
jgi:hypothetical protein